MLSAKFASMLVVKALVVLAALLPVCISAASAQEAAADKFVYIGSVPHEHMSVRALAFDPDDAFLWAQTAYGLTATRVSRFSIASGTETFSFALDAELAGPPVLFDMDTGSVVRRDSKGFERIALDTGKRLWRYDTTDPFDGFSIPVLTSDGKRALHVQLAGEFATLYDLEKQAPVRVYDSQKLQPDLASYLTGFHAPAVSSGDGSHVLATFDTLYLLSASGDVIWKHKEDEIVSSARLSDDGLRLVTGPHKREDGSEYLALREIENGNTSERFDVAELDDFLLSRDGRFLLALDRKKSRIQVWNLDVPSSALTYEGGRKRIGSAAFSDDGERLVFALERSDGRQGEFAFFELGGTPPDALPDEEESRRLVTNTGHSALVTASTVSPDGLLMASGDSEGYLWLWHVPTRRAIRGNALPGQSISDLAFLDSKTALIAGSQGIYLWDATTGKLSPFDPVEYNRLPIAKFQKAGDFIWFWDNADIAVLDRKNERLRFESIGFHSDYGSLIETLRVSPDGREFAVTASNGDVYRFDAQTRQLLERLQGQTGEIFKLAYGADGKELFAVLSEDDPAGGKKQHIVAWRLSGPDAATGSSSLLYKTAIGDEYLSDIWLATDGHHLVVTGGNEKYWLVDPLTGDIAAERRWFPAEAGLKAIYGVKIKPVPGSSRAIVQAGALPFQLSAIDFDRGEWIGAFRTEVSPFQAVRFSKDGKSLMFNAPGYVHLWSLEEGREVKRLTNLSRNPAFDNLAPDERGLLTLDYQQGASNNALATDIRFWNPRVGNRTVMTIPTTVQDPSNGRFAMNAPQKVRFSNSGNHISFQGSRFLAVWDIKSGATRLTAYDAFPVAGDGIVFSHDDRLATAPLEMADDGFARLATWDLETGQELWRTKLPAKVTASVSYMSNTDTLLVGDQLGGVLWTYNARTGEQLGEIDLRRYGQPVRVANAGTGKADLIASSWLGHAALARSDDPDQVIEFAGQAQIIAAAYSNDETWLATGDDRNHVVLRDAETGEELARFAAQAARGNTISFSPDDSLLAVVETDGSATLWNTLTGEKLVKMMSLQEDGGWLTVAPDGRYDASDPGDVAALSWVRKSDPLTPLPVSVFYRDYYEPRLLPRLLALDNFPEIRDIADIDIHVPGVTIDKVAETERGLLSVTVSVEETMRDIADGGYSLKLFRDRQLVGQFPDPFGQEHGTSVQSDKAGRSLITFSGIKLPLSDKADDIRTFSAYAFNADGVKGERVSFSYRYNAETGVRTPRAYVLTIGVNAYQNPAWNLRYAVADADALRSTLASKLGSETAQSYKDIVPIALVASGDDGRPVTATRKHIKAVIDVLAGRSADPDVLAEIDGAQELRAVNPEDLVVLTFSGHGYANPDGNFHLFPWDIGTGNDRSLTPELLDRTITSATLADWLYAMDAGRTVIIIDACNSAAVVEANGFKPGPMNSRSLGQLAYDKGMQIITASQAENVALESELVQHGLLTYALVSEGLENLEADFQPADGQITLSEWLEYGTGRVPDLYRQVREGQLDPLTKGAVDLGTIIRYDDEDANVQRPSLFDFLQRRSDIVIETSSNARP